MFGIKNRSRRSQIVRPQRRKKQQSLEWQQDSNIQKQLEEIIENIGLEHLKFGRIFCYRTTGSKARAYARIWAFPKIFQQVLSIEPAYVIEVLSEKFDKLSVEDKIKVLIHELLHIPKNFSGSLLPHKYGGKRIDREVERLFKMMKVK